jgi:hypothetical protein
MELDLSVFKEKNRPKLKLDRFDLNRFSIQSESNFLKIKNLVSWVFYPNQTVCEHH